MRLWLALVLLVAASAYAGDRWYLNHQANWGTVVPGRIYRSATVSRRLIRQKLAANHIGVIVFLSRDTGDDPFNSIDRITSS